MLMLVVMNESPSLAAAVWGIDVFMFVSGEQQSSTTQTRQAIGLISGFLSLHGIC